MRSSGDMRNMACSCAGAGWDGVEGGCERILEKQGGTDWCGGLHPKNNGKPTVLCLVHPPPPL